MPTIFSTRFTLGHILRNLFTSLPQEISSHKFLFKWSSLFLHDSSFFRAEKTTFFLLRFSSFFFKSRSYTEVGFVFAISAELQKSDYVRGERERWKGTERTRTRESLLRARASAVVGRCCCCCCSTWPELRLTARVCRSCAAARFFIRVMREKDIEIKKEVLNRRKKNE